MGILDVALSVQRSLDKLEKLSNYGWDDEWLGEAYALLEIQSPDEVALLENTIDNKVKR